MCGIALPYARATLVKTSYSLPEKISRAPILPSISTSQAVCAWTLNREVRSLALAISCEVNIVPNRMIPTSILLAASDAKDMRARTVVLSGGYIDEKDAGETCEHDAKTL